MRAKFNRSGPKPRCTWATSCSPSARRKNWPSLKRLLGDVVVESMYDPSGKVTSELLLVSRPDVVGKSFRELCLWERFGVVVTRCGARASS